MADAPTPRTSVSRRLRRAGRRGPVTSRPRARPASTCPPRSSSPSCPAAGRPGADRHVAPTRPPSPESTSPRPAGDRAAAGAAGCASAPAQASSASQQRRLSPAEVARRRGARLPDLSSAARRGRGAAAARRAGAASRPRHRRARVAAAELRLAPEPRCAHLRRSTSSRPRSPTTRVTSTACGARSSSSTASKRSRAELPLLRRLARDLRTANWKVNVTLEMRDWVYGTYLPPRLIRIYPAPSGCEHGARRRPGHDVGGRLPRRLHDRARGRQASAYNRQISCGDDVISRIIYAKRKRGLSACSTSPSRRSTTCSTSCSRATVSSSTEIHEVTVAGNTTMTHLLLGLDPRFLREEPYIPTVTSAPKLVAGELGLNVNKLARVHVLPAVGSYVGGDITAGVIASGMFATDDLTLFIDIGTNGEMVLGTKDWLLSCACSAGPAFEGGGVRHGMRASAGAIEDVFIDDATLEPSFRTVNDAPAIGICGSGLLDLLAELFVTGVVDKSGHIDRDCPKRPGEGPGRRARVRRLLGSRGWRRPRHRPHRVRHQRPDPRQGGDLRRLRSALPQRRGRPRRRASRSSSAAPSVSTSTSRRRSASACCPTSPSSASSSSATPAPRAPTRRCCA